MIPKRASRLLADALKRFLALLVSIGLVAGPIATSPVALAQGDTGVSGSELAVLDEFVALVDEMRSSIERERFDLDELAFELAFEDAGTLVQWVEENVAFEAYPGVLRGASGTLNAGAGNSWDQALLLATLLRGAGYEARIARGRLPDASVATLLERMVSRPQASPDPALPPVQARSFLEELARVAGVDEDEERTLLDVALGGDAASDGPRIEEARRVAGDLSGLMTDRSVWSDAEDGLQAMRDEALDYAWVEYRLASSDPWSRAHPAFGGDPTSLDVIEADAVFTDSLPDSVQHRVRLEVFVERSIGGDVSEVPVMDPWERPTANLYGVPITFAAVPDGVVSEAVEDEELARATVRTGFFYPTLMGLPAPGAMAFDLNGFAVAPDAAASPMAGVFQALGSVGARAASLLGTLGTEERAEDGQLRRIFARVTAIAPDGTETEHMRTIGEAGATATETVHAMSRPFTVTVITGRYDHAYALHETLRKVGMLGRLVLASGASSVETEGFALDMSLIADVDTSWGGHLSLVPAFDRFADIVADETLLYRHAPTIIAHYGLSPLEVQGREAVDVLANPRRAIHRGGALAWDRDAMVAMGVWETLNESVALAAEADEAWSTMGAIAGARAQGIELVVLAGDPATALERVDLPPQALEHLARDLGNGYAVVVPVAATLAGDPVGWWRIHPVTGETLGIMEDGRGLTTTETIVIAGIAGKTLAVLCITAAMIADQQGVIANGMSKVYSCVGLGVGTVGLALSGPAAGIAYAITVLLVGLDVFEVGF